MENCPICIQQLGKEVRIHVHTFVQKLIFGPPEGGPILFLLSPEVSGTMSIYIYMSTTWRTRSRYVIFRLYFGKIHSFAPDFISEESFRPEEFFEVLF